MVPEKWSDFLQGIGWKRSDRDTATSLLKPPGRDRINIPRLFANGVNDPHPKDAGVIQLFWADAGDNHPIIVVANRNIAGIIILTCIIGQTKIRKPLQTASTTKRQRGPQDNGVLLAKRGSVDEPFRTVNDVFHKQPFEMPLYCGKNTVPRGKF
jgi:hypothetical protein